MILGDALARYAFALGSYQTAWRYADDGLREASAIAGISATWATFRHDAGPASVGPAHKGAVDADLLTRSDDPRRDAVLLWLTKHAAPPIAAAAEMVARMVSASRRFSSDEQSLITAAMDAIQRPAEAPGRIGSVLGFGAGLKDNPLLQPLSMLANAVDHLFCDADFVEAAGTEIVRAISGKTLRHYVSADPGATWALNLALLAQRSLVKAAPPPPGLVSRLLFREDVDPDRQAADLIHRATGAFEAAYASLDQLHTELDRGQRVLGHLSRNARAQDAWRLVAALRVVTRSQLVRALNLSRAGADLQAHTLAQAGLVTLASGGRICWQSGRARPAPSPSPVHGALSQATREFDDAMAAIDKLLATTAAKE